MVRSALRDCGRDPCIVSGRTRRFLHKLLPLAALLSSLPTARTPSHTTCTCARATVPCHRPSHRCHPQLPFLSSTRHTHHFICRPLSSHNHGFVYHWTPTHHFLPLHLPPPCSPPVCSEFGLLKHGDIGKLAQADQRLTRGRETAKETHSERNRGANIAGTVGGKWSSGETVCQSDRLARAQIQ